MTTRRQTVQKWLGLGPSWRLRGVPTAHATRVAPIAETTLGLSLIPEQTYTAIAAHPTTTPVEIALTTTSDVSATTTCPAANQDWKVLKPSILHCQQCALAQTRTQVVVERGNDCAKWMIIGEAPGEQEDRQGRPFVGRAGQLLDNMLLALKLNAQHDVYITNVIKCRPPGNRTPKPEEITPCFPYLKQQIKHVHPVLILALGRTAAQTLLNTDATIGRLRGSIHYHGNIPVIVSYHPAYLLRNLPEKAKAWQDLVFAKTLFQSLQDYTSSA